MKIEKLEKIIVCSVGLSALTFVTCHYVGNETMIKNCQQNIIKIIID